MNSTLVKRLDALERHGGRETCQCVLFPSLDDNAPPPPALCPHGRPWAIRVVYDDPPRPSEEVPHDA